MNSIDSCFQKINVKFPQLDYKKLKGIFFESYGETFKQYQINDYDYLNEMILSKVEFHIQPDRVLFCEINEQGADPHIDESMVAANFYIQPANCTTTFWTLKETGKPIILPQKQNNGKYFENSVRRYNYEDLEKISSFDAEQGDLYILNIKQIHSAKKHTDDNTVRQIIRWLWDRNDFDNIVNSIKIK